MSKKSGAQAGEGKLESRFAALTSGLLARKGQAAPSNSPVIDPAEETEAFTLSDALIPRKKDGKDKDGRTRGAASPSPLSIAPRAAPPAIARAEPPAAPAPAPAPAPKPQPARPAAAMRAEPAPAPKAAPKPVSAPAPQPITVINERSFEAGYPDNPSAEEIEALEAEADEVASYFENFGADAVPEARDLFFDDDPAPAHDPLDDLDDGFDDDQPAPPAATNGGAAAPAETRATVSAQLGARAFMRLSLGAAELNLSSEDLIAEAIEEYLDARGIDSLGGEEFLKKLATARSRGGEA